VLAGSRQPTAAYASSQQSGVCQPAKPKDQVHSTNWPGLFRPVITTYPRVAVVSPIHARSPNQRNFLVRSQITFKESEP